jgi:hypothetical protein
VEEVSVLNRLRLLIQPVPEWVRGKRFSPYQWGERVKYVVVVGYSIIAPPKNYKSYLDLYYLVIS